jgi:hypothetical protein
MSKLPELKACSELPSEIENEEHNGRSEIENEKNNGRESAKINVLNVLSFLFCKKDKLVYFIVSFCFIPLPKINFLFSNKGIFTRLFGICPPYHSRTKARATFYLKSTIHLRFTIVHHLLNNA